jgi:hypothetical protein
MVHAALTIVFSIQCCEFYDTVSHNQTITSTTTQRLRNLKTVASEAMVVVTHVFWTSQDNCHGVKYLAPHL